MDKNIRISILCQIYGKLLTEKQYQVLNDYYNNDLSLSEIAENLQITRQAVRDNIKKGENKLFEYEKKLGIMKKTVESQEKIAEVLSEITTIETKMTDKEIAEVLEDVKNKLSVLI